ncbi:unnamed protein product [Symbiodinium natans]|uniref:Uncharacterized protein n=1 Tax=Symbiodinium natans TaxID=878477 RepID=A0A812K2Y9_9DINO|nr:unnamed protein product [Symbiodinium natans]
MWLIGTGQTARRVSSNVEDGLGLHLSQLLQHNGGTSTAPDSHEAMSPPPPPLLFASCKVTPLSPKPAWVPVPMRAALNLMSALERSCTRWSSWASSAHG